MEMVEWVRSQPSRFLLSEFTYPSEAALREGFHKMVSSMRGEEMGVSGNVLIGLGAAIILVGMAIAWTPSEDSSSSRIVGATLAGTGILTSAMGQLIKSLKRVASRIDALREESRERHMVSRGEGPIDD